MNTIPNILYKYRSYEGINANENYGTKTLVDFQLFANSPRSFNDPFDVAMPYKYNKDSFTQDNFVKRYISYKQNHSNGKSSLCLKQEAIDRYRYIVESPQQHWKENEETISNMDNEFYGILSLSKVPDSILMWSHYANFHKGYCIGFDSGALLNSIGLNYQQFGCKFGPVKYASNYPSIDFMREFDLSTSFERCFTKHHCWSYEEEYRLVLHNKANEIITYPNNIIREIYLGCKIPETNKAEIKTFLKNNEMQVNLFQMEMGYDKFELVATLVNYH